VGNVAESGFHGLWIAGRIEYQSKNSPPVSEPSSSRVSLPQWNDVIGGQRRARELEPILSRVHDGNFRTS